MPQQKLFPHVRANMDREQTTLRLPAELMEQLKQEAQEMGVSFNGYLLMLIHKGRHDLHQ